MKKRRLRNTLHFIFFMVVTVLLSAIITFMLYFLIAARGMKDVKMLNVERITKELIKEENGYTLTEEGKSVLKENHCFVFLIDKFGQVIWGYHKPKEIPDQFSLQEVASFSRWYLMDYPVQNWHYQNEILVMGYPRNTLWKYVIEMPIIQIDLLIHWMLPLMFFIMGCIFSLGTIWNQRQSRKQDKAQTEWIAGVSHDIRTPLTMIMGYAGELYEAKSNSNEQREQSEIILCQSMRIKSLVEDFNMVNKLNYGMVSMEKKKVRLAGIIRQIVADVMNSGLDERYEISLHISEDCVVRADEKLLYRAIINLVRNSIYHNPEGCSISISCKRTRFWNQIKIIDNGSGYPKEVLTHKSVPYTKLKSHGLGLVIVGRIIKAHHGRFRLYNQDGAVAEIMIR
ncbi:MAG: sensor histidine kinase [Velocimicrobium sp.]